MDKKVVDRMLHVLDVQYENVISCGNSSDVQEQIIYYDGMRTMTDDILLMENYVTIRNDCGEHDIVKY